MLWMRHPAGPAGTRKPKCPSTTARRAVEGPHARTCGSGASQERTMGSSIADANRRPEPPPGVIGGRDPLAIPAEVKASIRILVVDDERTLRESCASVLQMDGYNVT